MTSIKRPTAQVDDNSAPESTTSTNDFTRYQTAIADQVAWQELWRGFYPATEYQSLDGIWLPNFTRPIKARAYFNNTPDSPPQYGARLFPDQPDHTEAIFGAMAYDADREVVLSLGNRLVEIGPQRVRTLDGQDLDVLMNLSENPTSNIGEQTIVFSRPGNESKLSTKDFLASLIGAIEIKDAVHLERTAVSESLQHIHVTYKVPADISWDSHAHTVDFVADIPLPKPGHKDFVSGLLQALHLNNGRPAQHFPESAAAIRLQEILFAKPNSVHITIDPGTPKEMYAKPDRFLGKKLVLLLTQTAGGFFERQYLQNLDPNKPALEQNSSVGVTIPDIKTTLIHNTGGNVVRKTEVGYTSAPYHTEYFEKATPIKGKDDTAYELSEMRVVAASGEELMELAFTTGHGRGIRDLGLASDIEQNGRFTMSIKGQAGFSYGRFTVSPTDTRKFRSACYTTIELYPDFTPDMLRKKVILHVLHTEQGIYTETQVVPFQLVEPPEQHIEKARH